MRSITLHIQDDSCLEGRCQIALDLVRAFDGHLTCLQAIPFETGLPGELYGAVAAQMLPLLREDAAKLQVQLEARLTREGVAWDWIVQDGSAQRQLLAHAGLSDLIVVGACPEDRRKTGYSLLAADVVIEAMTPVLLVPERAQAFNVSAPGAVAWNGSQEAARALRAALPLLQRAEAVYLLYVSKTADPADLPPIEAAHYLARHGIECDVVELPRDGRTIDEALVEAAATRRAGWLVMGAYGHSRLRESLLGGVTKSMMTDPELPILLMH